MKLAKFLVTPELLREALRLPPGTELRGALLDGESMCFEFTIEHEALPDQPAGSIGRCEPRFTRTEQGEVVFQDWGVR